MTENRVMIQLLIATGSALSIMSTSFENLLRIRPSGVVSKNDIGSRNTLRNNLLCKSRAARRHPNAKITDVANKVTAKNKSKIKVKTKIIISYSEVT